MTAPIKRGWVPERVIENGDPDLTIGWAKRIEGDRWEAHGIDGALLGTFATKGAAIDAVARAYEWKRMGAA